MLWGNALVQEPLPGVVEPGRDLLLRRTDRGIGAAVKRIGCKECIREEENMVRTRCNSPAVHVRATVGVAHITVVRSVTSASISFSSLDGYG